MKKQYKIRITFTFLFFCSLYLIILGHLYSLQIKQRDFFVQLGEQQYHITLKTTPERAIIYDRNQQFLAINQDSLSAFILPKTLESVETLEPFLKKQFPAALDRLYKNQQAHFMYVKRKLTAHQQELIEKSKSKDIKILKEPNRYYPILSAGPIVGITDVDNNGLFGIELLYNQQLSGCPSTYRLEKDARSGQFYFKKETKVEGKEGSPVTLTLDSTLQFLAYEELKATILQFNAAEGSVIIMNPTNGEILAMVNYPTFDPHATENLDLSKTKNKIATEAYELGSVIKIFLAMAALEEGVVKPDELIDCENTQIGYVNGIKISTWPHGHGLITFAEVIQFSNNIGVAKVALRLGPKLYTHYKRVGFGTKTGLNWPGEQAGFVNPPEQWTKPSIISLSFGYEITATLLQLAQAFCMIANRGIPIIPHIILDQKIEQFTIPLYSPQTVEIIRSILEKTVTQGTARKAALKGYTVMGKTGTANMVIDGAYNTEHNIYTFAGIIEKGDYKRVIVTFVKEAQGKNLYASSVAAPLFERIAECVLIHDKIIVEGQNEA